MLRLLSSPRSKMGAPAHIAQVVEAKGIVAMGRVDFGIADSRWLSSRALTRFRGIALRD